jgi:hypothetical protein
MFLARTTALAARTSLKTAAASQSIAYLTQRNMSSASEPLVLAEKSASGKVTILRLNRPKALNALSSPLFDQLNIELEKADADESVGAIVITGSDKAFAAGADIKEMKDKDCKLPPPVEGGLVHHPYSRDNVQEQFPGHLDPNRRSPQADHRSRVGLRRKP